jgi:hypothetical protein
MGNWTHKNIITEPALRIRRVVFAHAARAAVFVYSHASSMVISPAAEADMIAMLILPVVTRVMM